MWNDLYLGHTLRLCKGLHCSCGSTVVGQAWLVGLKEGEKSSGSFKGGSDRTAGKELWKLCFSLSASGVGY